tara:strand:- start:14368 stop:14544 length:177 start_codon:yes stop_codon:yes gene_type:complete
LSPEEISSYNKKIKGPKIPAREKYNTQLANPFYIFVFPQFKKIQNIKEASNKYKRTVD